MTEDDMFAELADGAPGFAGVFADTGGLLILRAVPEGQTVGPARRASSQATLRSALASFLSAHSIPTEGRQIVVRTARYDFRQLHDWHDQVIDALSLPGAVYTDLDERANRVTLAFTAAAVANGTSEKARAMAIAAGVPSDAIQIREALPFRRTSTVRDQFRPTEGGIEIVIGNGICTLGFNASWTNPQTGQVSSAFVTASHCTTVQGQVTGDTAVQPLGGTKIGTEAYDPAYYAGSLGNICPTGRHCRYSDAAVFTYAAGISSPYLIARTIKDSILIDSNHPTFAVLAKGTFGGMSLIPFSKTGRTTGWTTGSLGLTCVRADQFDANGFDTGITMLCQDFVGANTQPGDSGAPVFRQFASNENQAALFGINWGSNGVGGPVFSALYYIEQEVGALTVF